MIEAAHELGTENLLTIAGSTYIPWIPEREPVPIDVCATRPASRSANWSRSPKSTASNLNIENIVFNGYLTTPDEMNAFVDTFGSKHVQVHFDTGNVMLFQFPEHWIPILGKRIQNVHFKEFSKKGTDHSLDSFRTLLDGTTNWPAVMDALEQTGLRGLRHVRVFPSVSSLSRGPDRADLGCARPHPRPQTGTQAMTFGSDSGNGGAPPRPSATLLGVPIDLGTGRHTSDLCGACADELAFSLMDRHEAMTSPSSQVIAIKSR